MSNIQVFTGTLAGTEQTLTTSRIVANVFGRHHRDVLRSVDQLDCSEEFTERNFALSEYRDPRGRNLREFRMTRDGFMFLAMGFTGREAARRKEGFIATFNQMEAQLRKPAPPALPDHFTIASQLVSEMLQSLQGQVAAQGMQIERLTRALIGSKESELRLRRSREAEARQARINRVIAMERAGYGRELIQAETGLSFNYIRQIVFKARQLGDLPAADARQGALL